MRKKSRFEGGSSFFGEGWSHNESPTFPPVRTQKKHSRCGLAPRFGCSRCESTCRTGNVATFTLQGLLSAEHNVETLRTRLTQVADLRDTQGIRRDHRAIVTRLDEVEEW